MYKLTRENNVIRISDNASIALPANEAEGWNYMDWLTAGNTPEPYVEPPVPIPTSVLMYQARLALLNIGITSVAVEDIINAMPSPQKEQALILWEFSPTVKRENGFVSMIAPALNLSEAGIDEFFMTAVGL